MFSNKKITFCSKQIYFKEQTNKNTNFSHFVSLRSHVDHSGVWWCHQVVKYQVCQQKMPCYSILLWHTDLSLIKSFHFVLILSLVTTRINKLKFLIHIIKLFIYSLLVYYPYDGSWHQNLGYLKRKKHNEINRKEK